MQILNTFKRLAQSRSGWETKGQVTGSDEFSAPKAIICYRRLGLIQLGVITRGIGSDTSEIGSAANVRLAGAHLS